MGARKRLAAEARKQKKQEVALAKLNHVPTSPRKMRLLADIIRGENADKALFILKYSKKHAAQRLEKLLLSAIANWQTKNEGVDADEAQLYIKEIYVDSARQLKRLRPAPQGRGYRIRKRSNHITLVLDSKQK